MGLLSFIVVILLIGAFFGFIFSKKGEEGEAAVGGAKKAGCLLVVLGVLVLVAIVLIIALDL